MGERLPARSRNWREWCREVGLIRDTKFIGLNKACWEALEKEIKDTEIEHIDYKGNPYKISWAYENNQLDIIHHKFDDLTVYLENENGKPNIKPSLERPYSWDNIIFQDEEGEPPPENILNEMANTPPGNKWLTPLPKGRGFEAFDQEWHNTLNKYKLCVIGDITHSPTKRKWYQPHKPEWSCSKCHKAMKLVPTFEQL